VDSASFVLADLCVAVGVDVARSDIFVICSLVELDERTDDDVRLRFGMKTSRE
jgi:hypothetical protein